MRSRSYPQALCRLVGRGSGDKDKGNRNVAGTMPEVCLQGELMPGRGLSLICVLREDFLQEKGEEGRCPGQREEQEQRHNQDTGEKPEQCGLLKRQHGPGRCGRCRWTGALPEVQPALMLQELCSNCDALWEPVEGILNLCGQSMGHTESSESKRGPHRDHSQRKVPLYLLEAQTK